MPNVLIFIVISFRSSPTKSPRKTSTNANQAPPERQQPLYYAVLFTELHEEELPENSNNVNSANRNGEYVTSGRGGVDSSSLHVSTSNSNSTTGQFHTKDSTKSWNVTQMMQHIGKFWTSTKEDESDEEYASDEEYSGFDTLRSHSHA